MLTCGVDFFDLVPQFVLSVLTLGKVCLEVSMKTITDNMQATYLTELDMNEKLSKDYYFIITAITRH